ncbi:MAG: P-loop NTPase [Acidimicrobiia bacterium]
MEPIEYLRALRQWWWVIVASVVVGVGVVTLVGSQNTTTYTATQDMLFAPDVQGEDAADPAVTLNRIAFLTTRGSIPDRVAEQLGSTDPIALARRVSAAVNAELRTLSITATGADAQRTERLANTFAHEVVASLDEQAASERELEVERLQVEVDDLERQLAALDRSIGANTEGGVLGGQREALGQRYSANLALLQELTTGPAPSSGLSTVAPARAVVAAGGGASRTTSFALAGFVSLLIGAGLALALMRFDTRIRTKEEAEEAFGLPVIAEIPLLSRARRDRHDVISITEPESPGAEAYRTLRTALIFGPRVRWSLNEATTPRRRRKDARVEEPSPARLSHTLLVVSPGVGEGKSTSVANLAVAFAESGKYVLVVSGDLRRPMVDTYLGVEEGPGVSELLAGEDEMRLVDIVRTTSTPDVRIAPSGEAVSNPGELLSHHGAELVDQARNLADVVLIDSPPLLATDDTSPLIPRIDEVLVVCRAGVTTAEAARRASELLSRLGASVAGVALVGVTATATPRGYYRAYTRSGRRAPREPNPEAGSADGGQSADDQRTKSTRPRASKTA